MSVQLATPKLGFILLIVLYGWVDDHMRTLALVDKVAPWARNWKVSMSHGSKWHVRKFTSLPVAACHGRLAWHYSLKRYIRHHWSLVEIAASLSSFGSLLRNGVSGGCRKRPTGEDPPENIGGASGWKDWRRGYKMIF
jgi:hypothetical protein